MIIADTSVIIKLVIPEIHTDVALRLRDQGIGAPSIWMAEAGNVLWRKQETKLLSAGNAKRLYTLLLNGPIVSLPFEQDAPDALDISATLAHPIYDCFFLAAAIREDTVVATDDGRFAAAVRRNGKWASRLRLLAEI